ncbi:O-antigen ligase family protein [Rhodococcus sp. GXMU-t2271]|uniref:O-antigen ligase family protein n=1 Tax=Rhodococcus sp. GXMU-t2271 TaxID=3059079 RepID=UPI00352A0E3F
MLGIIAALSAGIAVVVSPIVGVAIAGVLLAGVADSLPLAGIFFGILAVRAISDGSSVGNGPAGLGSVASWSGLAFLLMGTGAVLLRRRGIGQAALILVAVFVSTWYAVENYSGSVWKEGLRVASIVCAFLLVLNLGRRINLLDALRMLQAIACFSATFSIYQFLTGTGMIVDHVKRPAGTLAHPNSAALVYGIALTATLYMLLKRKQSILNLLIATLLGAALILTASIGGLVTAAVMAIALVVLVTEIPTWVRALSVFAVLAAGYTFSRTEIGSVRIDEFSSSDLVGAPSNSFEWRVYAWQRILEVWRAEPYFGQGLGATTSRMIGVENVPHNEYVRFITELGILGAGLVAVVFAWIARKLWRLRREEGELGEFANLNLAFLAGLLVNSAGANTFLYSVPVLMLCLPIAGMFALKAERSADAPEFSDPVRTPAGSRSFGQRQEVRTV